MFSMCCYVEQNFVFETRKINSLEALDLILF